MLDLLTCTIYMYKYHVLPTQISTNESLFAAVVVVVVVVVVLIFSFFFVRGLVVVLLFLFFILWSLRVLDLVAEIIELREAPNSPHQHQEPVQLCYATGFARPCLRLLGPRMRSCLHVTQLPPCWMMLSRPHWQTLPNACVS